MKRKHANSSQRRELARGPSVAANGELVGTLRAARGLTQAQLAKLVGVDTKSIVRIESGESKNRAEILRRIANVLGVDYEPLLASAATTSSARTGHREWDILSAELDCEDTRTSHGLRVDRFLLTSRTVDGRRARAKRYDLSRAGREDEAFLNEVLCRHTVVCDLVRSPHVLKTYLCEPDEAAPYWWVIEEFFDGIPLPQLLTKLTRARSMRISYQILEALAALHKADVICRGLTANAIVVRTSDWLVVLTDFELAKIRSSQQTVSPKSGFPKNPYFAPEVSEGGKVSAQADLFSWAVITAEMLLRGRAPTLATEQLLPLLRNLKLQPDFLRLLEQSLSVAAVKRPASAAKLAASLKPIVDAACEEESREC